MVTLNEVQIPLCQSLSQGYPVNSLSCVLFCILAISVFFKLSQLPMWPLLHLMYWFYYQFYCICYLISSQLWLLRVWITCHHNHQYYIFHAKTLSSWHLLYPIYIHICLLFSLFTCYLISYSAFQSEFGVDKFLWQVFSLGILEVWVLPGWICLGAWLNGVLSSSWMSYPSVALCTTMKDSWVSTMSPTQNICGLAMRKLEWHMNCIYPDFTFCSLPDQSGTWHN